MTCCPTCGHTVEDVPLAMLLEAVTAPVQRGILEVLARAGVGVMVPRARILARTHGGTGSEAEGSDTASALSSSRIALNGKLAPLGWTVRASPNGTRDPRWWLERRGNAD